MDNVFVRIDDRLIHGQVLIKWVKHIQCSEVVIIDDGIFNDPVMSSVLRISCPNNVDLGIYDFSTGIQKLKSKRHGKILLLFKDLLTFDKVQDALNINAVNIARMPFHRDKERLFDNIYTSLEEKRILKDLIRKGIDIYIQMVPDSEPVRFHDFEDEND